MVAYGSGQRHDNPFHNIDVVLNGNINPPPWPVEIHPNADNPYLVPISSDPEPEEASLDDLTGMIRDWPDYNWNASEHEDSWLAVDFVFNAHFNNQPDEDDPEETLIYNIDVAPEISDDYVVFYVDDVDGNGVIDPDEDVVNSQHFVGNLLGDPSAEAGQSGYEAPETQRDLYPRIRDDLSYEGENAWLWDADPFGPSPIFDFTGLIDQKQIDLAIGVDPPPEGVEEQVFLAWETGGTVWTSRYFKIEGIGPTDVPGLPHLLSDAMAKDIANKMKDPRVTGVTIGSGQLPSGEVDSYDVPGGSGEQLRTVPVRKADRITIRFSEEVDVTADDLTLDRISARRRARARTSPRVLASNGQVHEHLYSNMGICRVRS